MTQGWVMLYVKCVSKGSCISVRKFTQKGHHIYHKKASRKYALSRITTFPLT